MDSALVDIFDMADDVEVITDQEVNSTPIVELTPEVNINTLPTPDVISVVENKSKVKRKMDKVLLVQLVLLITWGIMTTLVYFFGYDIFSPFIDIS